jgi:serine-type D-Ala-D-Ala carboxypeptidase/endopeptidase
MRLHSFFVPVSALVLVVSGCERKPGDGASPAPVPSAAPLEERVAGIVQPVVEHGWAQAVMVGTLKDGEERYFGFGAIDRDGTAPDADTVFEIGSVTKVFTAIVLADLAARGEVALDDPVAWHLPDDFNLPKPGGKPITLEALAAHTSGLPVIAANFWEDGDSIFDNDTGGRRWAGYSAARLRAFLANPAPPVNDSRPYIYSNLGAGLLGHALSRRAGQPIEKLIHSRICEPLGMTSTGTDVPLSTPGHNADGVPVQPWVLGESILGGAFALRSSCRDLIRFARANLGDGAGDLAGALTESHRPRADINPAERTALGWRVNVNGVIYTTGATGGYRCALSIHPPTKSAIVILANTQVGGATGARALLFDGLAGSLLNSLVGGPPINVPFPRTAAPPASPEDYPGTYEPVPAGAGPTLVVKLVNGRLTTTGPGGMTLRLWPAGEDAFFLRAHDAELKFERDAAGKVTGAKVKFEGNQATLERKRD